MRYHNIQNITLLKPHNFTSKSFAIDNYKGAWILELSIAKNIRSLHPMEGMTKEDYIMSNHKLTLRELVNLIKNSTA